MKKHLRARLLQHLLARSRDVLALLVRDSLAREHGHLALKISLALLQHGVA